MVNLTIDGRAIQAKPGSTILEVAKENGIFIPFLCYHPALKPIGSCRICVVDVKPGPPRPIPACATTGHRRHGGGDRLRPGWRPCARS